MHRPWTGLTAWLLEEFEPDEGVDLKDTTLTQGHGLVGRTMHSRPARFAVPHGSDAFGCGR
jgi:hypothetical protein